MTDPSGDPRPSQPPDAAGSSASAADPTVAVPSGESQPGAAAAPPRSPRRRRRAAPTPVDLGRRKFFRQFAGELINTAALAAGAAQALQQVSAEAASVILNPEGAARRLGAAATT